MPEKSKTKTLVPSSSPLPLWIAFGLALLCLVVFSPALGFKFVNYDDPDYVTRNEIVQQGLTWTGIKWAFTSAAAFNWHPVTWLSHMLDCQFFGLKPGGHHATSILLHTCNTLLLFLLLTRLTGALWRSAMVAALFSMHPLRLESVVWVCERKDVLSAFFMLLTLLAYHRAVTGKRALIGSIYYWLALLFFALGLMSKPMLVTLPFVLLLLDFWPLRRLTMNSDKGQPQRSILHLVVEKIPFFALTGASIAVTYLVQKSQGAVTGFGFVSPVERIANALVSVLRYVGKLFWPGDLAVYYPMPATWPAWLVSAAVALIFGVAALAIWQRRQRPFLAVGWFWFLGTLVPVIGLVQVGTQAMADRYTYIPMMGLLVMLVWAGAELTPKRWLGAVMGAILVTASVIATAVQLPCWKNSETLFAHALKTTKKQHRRNDHVRERS